MHQHANHDYDNHVEEHFTAPAVVRDIVIGMADGLTVPFALAAGLSGAVSTTGIIITAGVAEVAAGSIAMGLGGYLAAKSESEHYYSELDREYRETVDLPHVEREEVAVVFREYGLEGEKLDHVVDAICSDQDRWVDFMMKFELGLEEPNPKRARSSARNIALSYIIGGAIPLGPYFFYDSVQQALILSIIITLMALLGFGYVKGRYTSDHPFKSALQTLFVGGLAAATAYGVASLLS